MGRAQTRPAPRRCPTATPHRPRAPITHALSTDSFLILSSSFLCHGHLSFWGCSYTPWHPDFFLRYFLSPFYVVLMRGNLRQLLWIKGASMVGFQGKDAPSWSKRHHGGEGYWTPLAVWQRRHPGQAVMLFLGCSELPWLSLTLKSAYAAPMSSEHAPSRVLVQIPFLLSGTQFCFCACPLNLPSFTSHQTLGDDTPSLVLWVPLRT